MSEDDIIFRVGEEVVGIIERAFADGADFDEILEEISFQVGTAFDNRAEYAA